MRNTRLIATLLALATFAIVVSDARAMYDAKHGRWLQRDPIGTGDIVTHDQQGGPRITIAAAVATSARVGLSGRAPVSRFIPRDPVVARPTASQFIPRDAANVKARISQAGLENLYVDGMNLYQYVRSNPQGYVDSLGLINAELTGCSTKYWSCIFSLDSSRDCGAEWAGCVRDAMPSFSPLDDTSSACDKYGCNDTYFGAYARCFCKCAGNSDWSRYVRGCLRAMYDADADPGLAHWTCYELADRKYDRPYTTLAWCYAKCKDLNPFK
jgi:hypothetical protein